MSARHIHVIGGGVSGLAAALQLSLMGEHVTLYEAAPFGGGLASVATKPSAARPTVRRAGVGYPVGFDPFPARTTTSYGVYALPQTFFLNAQHRIVSHVLGPVTMTELTRGVALMDGRHQERG